MKNLRTSLMAIATTTALMCSFVATSIPAYASSDTVTLSGGDLIKLPDDGNPATNVDAAIYYYGLDGLRYVFPNSKTYFTWYTGFSNVKSVSATQMGSIGIGGNVTYRPGVKMIKIDSDPKVYVIDMSGTRRWVSTEAAAIALYGAKWNKNIDDVPDAFFSNYPMGADIVTASDFNSENLKVTIQTISTDKRLSSPVEITINADGSFSPATITVSLGRAVRFTNKTSSVYRLAGDQNLLPGFDSAFIPAGMNYVYKFKKAGPWTYANHTNAAQQGSVTVTE